MLIATFVISMGEVRPVGDPDRKINVDGEINPAAYADRISALGPSDGLLSPLLATQCPMSR
ncbi:MAG TPA: hypothetical protein VJY34_14530 [Roseiarcus sp.]|nr:hypothetical protein [Roseiarcus sp.]